MAATRRDLTEAEPREAPIPSFLCSAGEASDDGAAPIGCVCVCVCVCVCARAREGCAFERREHLELFTSNQDQHSRGADQAELERQENESKGRPSRGHPVASAKELNSSVSC